jgi:hypothetical protein
LREPDGSSTRPFKCIYNLTRADLARVEDTAVDLIDVPMQFDKQAVVEWLDGTRLPESASSPEGLALLSNVMNVLVYLGAEALVDGIALELAEAVDAREMKMKDALVACNYEVAFTRALANLYDDPPRFRRAPIDTQPTHFVAALVKPNGVVERVEIAHVNAIVRIARLLYRGPVDAPEMMIVPDRFVGCCDVLRLDTALRPEASETVSRNVNGILEVYFDKYRPDPDNALPASFIHPNVVAGSVVCVLRWYHSTRGEGDSFTRLPQPWVRCSGFASLPEAWICDKLWMVLGKWIAGGHEVLTEDVGVVQEEHKEIHDTLVRLTNVQTALRHATRVSYGSYVDTERTSTRVSYGSYNEIVEVLQF